MNTNTIPPGLQSAVVAALVAAGGVTLPIPLAAQTAPGEIAGHTLPVPGDKVSGTTAKLFEVDAEMVAHMSPQGPGGTAAAVCHLASRRRD